jgi:hypothetical protein
VPYVSAEELLESIERGKQERFTGAKIAFVLLLLISFEWSMCGELDKQAERAAASVVEER